MTSLALLLLLATTAGAGDDVVATTLEGRTVSGRLQAWTDQEVSLETATGVESFAASNLLDVRWSREATANASPITLELIDGARLHCTTFTLAKREAAADGLCTGQPLAVSRDLLRQVNLAPATPALAAALEEAGRKDAAGDTLVVFNRDGKSVDYLSGVVGDVASEQVEFQWDGQRVQVKRSKIAAIVFYQARRPQLTEAACELSLADGSRIVARSASAKDGRLRVTTPAGVELDVPLEAVLRADFSAGKVVYLSDLDPSEVRWTPRVAAPASASTIAAFGMPRRDVSFSGSPLTLTWKDATAGARPEVRTYAKGLALRSRTELVYRLPENLRQFTAIAGIDPAAAGQGNVYLEIRGDDAVIWEGEIDGKQPPVEIAVPIKSARRLQLRVDYGDNLDYGDRLHLVDARVTK